MNKKNIYALLIALPLIFLLAAGAYFAVDTWTKYRDNKLTSEKLKNVKLLQSLEHSFFNELVCVMTVNHNQKEMQNICHKMEDTTNQFLSDIKAETFDSQLYALKNNIEQIRKEMALSSESTMDMLMKGELKKNIHDNIRRYISVLKYHLPNKEDQNHLELYLLLNDISYASEVEKAFIAYYLSRKKPITPEHLLFWDKIISMQKFSFINDQKYRFYSESLSKTWESETVQKFLRQIEDVRFDLMTHASTGKYQSSLIEWITLSNQKHKVLMHLEDTVIDGMLVSVNKRISDTLVEAIIASVLLLFTLLALYLLLRMTSMMKSEAVYFERLLNRMKTIKESKEKDLESSNPKVAYSFIENSFEEAFIEKEKLDIENKIKNRYILTLFYKMQKPVDMIKGYGALLKGTETTTEQDDFITYIEEGAKDLEKMMKLSPLELARGRAAELEIKKRSFDLIAETESSVEIFTLEASQRDIRLSLYTDPSLAYQVRGDNIRISEILNNLIDKAIHTTYTYGHVDVSLEKIDENDRELIVKYTVSEASKGYGKKELEKIREHLDQVNEKIVPGDMREQMLQISNNVLKQMGSKLEIESQEGEGSSYAFTLTLTKENPSSLPKLLNLDNKKIGIALPSLDIRRKQEENIEKYIQSCGLNCEFYDYDSLFSKTVSKKLPDLMLVYHHYARLEGEMEAFMKLDCDLVLMTSPLLRSTLDFEKYNFSAVVYAPMTYYKLLHILSGINQENKPVSNISEETVSEESIEIEEPEAFKGLRILLAEDNEIDQKLWKEKLNALGIDLTIAANGKEAFDKRRENDFDLIFMDIDMPLMDGYEATNKILYYERVNQLSHIPIIALVSSEEKREKYLKLGMDDTLLKSEKDEKLKEIIQRYGINMALMRAETEEDALIAKVFSDNFFKE